MKSAYAKKLPQRHAVVDSDRRLNEPWTWRQFSGWGAAWYPHIPERLAAVCLVLLDVICKEYTSDTLYIEIQCICNETTGKRLHAECLPTSSCPVSHIQHQEEINFKVSCISHTTILERNYLKRRNYSTRKMLDGNYDTRKMLDENHITKNTRKKPQHQED